jgi:ABC-2 type transport system permease protein
VQFIAMSLALAISLAVSGMSTGLGAVFIDLKQRNPAAIVSGFGGTLNLVLSLAYMLLVVVPFAAVFHLSFLGTIDPRSADTGVSLAVAWLVFLSILSAFIPLRLGRRHLATRDY